MDKDGRRERNTHTEINREREIFLTDIYQCIFHMSNYKANTMLTKG